MFFYFELSIKPNFDIVGIAVFMWKNDFETISTSNYVMNIQYGIGNIFVSREIAYSMEVNAYFGPRQINIPETTPNYGHRKTMFEVDYYRQTYPEM